MIETNPNRRHALITLAASAGAVLPFAANAQRAGGPVRLLVGYPAGGTFDNSARLLAEYLREELGRQVIVENKAGAGGRLVVDTLKMAPPDGSVVMLGPDALTGVFPLMYKRLNYDPKSDLVPVSPLLSFGYAFLAGSNPPAKSLADFVQWGRANPSRATYGHAARGAPPHFVGAMIGEAIGVKMTDVPYSGGAPAVTNLIGGQISSLVNPIGGQVFELHRSGKARVLAVTTAQRIPQLPDVPTFAELGYPSLTTVSTNVLYAPPGTSDATVATWNRVVRKVLENPELKEKFFALGLQPIPGSPEDVVAKTAADLKQWTPVIKALNVVPE